MNAGMEDHKDKLISHVLEEVLTTASELQTCEEVDKEKDMGRKSPSSGVNHQTVTLFLSDLIKVSRQHQQEKLVNCSLIYENVIIFLNTRC